MTGADLRELRRRLGLTQRELADRLGIHNVEVSVLESGRRRLARGIRARIALVEIVLRLEGREKAEAVALRKLAEEGLG